MPPEVTLALPVYNGERHLEDTIRSILGQTLTDFQLVISDNASTDGTGVICKDYAELDERVTYHRQDTNLGCRGNFHAVFDLGAGTRYFKWAGHDDLIEPEYLARCVGHLDSHPGDVLCQSLVRLIDGEGREVPDAPVPSAFGGATPHERLRAFFEGPKTYQTLFGVIRRDALARTRLLGPWFASDRALLVELSLHGGFGQVPEVLFVSRDHEGRGDYVSDDDRLAWYSPERAGQAEAGYWHHMAWVTRTLATTPMPPAERVKCIGELGRRASGKVGEWAPILAREARESIGARVRAARAARHHTPFGANRPAGGTPGTGGAGATSGSDGTGHPPSSGGDPRAA